MRLFVYKTAKASKALAVFECEKVAKGKATVYPNVDIQAVKPGMVCCPGEGRKADRATEYVVVDVERNTIVFEKETGTVHSPPLAEEEPKS